MGMNGPIDLRDRFEFRNAKSQAAATIAHTFARADVE